MGQSRKRSRNERRQRQARQARRAGKARKAPEAGQAPEAPEAPEGSSSRQQVETWWRSNPHWLEAELSALDAAGIKWERHEPEGDTLVLKIKVEVAGEVYALVAVFPDSYPYFRPEIYAPDLTLSHHQNPFTKALCLLGRATENWDQQPLAEYITERLPLTLEAACASSKDDAADLEEHQGEPITDYYTYQPDSCLLLDSDWPSLKPNTFGTMTVGISSVDPIRGAVLEFMDERHTILASADKAIAALYDVRLKGSWACLEEPIRSQDAGEIARLLYERQPAVGNPYFGHVASEPGKRLALTAVIFPEEVAWRTNGQGWLCLGMQRRGLRGSITTQLVRPYRAGKVDARVRAPELQGLPMTRVAVVGVGAIGAPLVLELARAGVGELRILDHDLADPATAVRWPFGVESAGLQKVNVLQSFLGVNYPHTRVTPIAHRVGALDVARNEASVIHDVLDGVDVLVDASAEFGVGYFLSEKARRMGIPYISVATTLGAWGGMIVRIRPGKTPGCWSCLKCHLKDETIAAAPFDPHGTIQPAACADPTFTGAGFDISLVAMAGVRAVVQTLTNEPGAYPDEDWDVAVLSLRDEKGNPTTPVWMTHTLSQHPSCEVCLD